MGWARPRNFPSPPPPFTQHRRFRRCRVSPTMFLEYILCEKQNAI